MNDKPISEILKNTGLAPVPSNNEMDGLMHELVKTIAAPTAQNKPIELGRGLPDPTIPDSIRKAFQQSAEKSEYPTPLPSAGLRETGKLPVNLVPAEFNLILAAILEHGAYKYAPHNFEKGMDPDDLLRGAESHLMALKAGVIYDPQSGLPHAGHAAWNMLTFAMQMMREPSLEELFISIVARRRAGKLTKVTREYATKHDFDFTADEPEFAASEWHERVASLRNLIKNKPSS